MRIVSRSTVVKGKFFSNMPSTKRMAARMSACRMMLASLSPRRRRLAMEKGRATPTMNRKNGKIQSVGVAPCHGTCWSTS